MIQLPRSTSNHLSASSTKMQTSKNTSQAPVPPIAALPKPTYTHVNNSLSLNYSTQLHVTLHIDGDIEKVQLHATVHLDGMVQLQVTVKLDMVVQLQVTVHTRWDGSIARYGAQETKATSMVDGRSLTKEIGRSFLAMRKMLMGRAAVGKKNISIRRAQLFLVR